MICITVGSSCNYGSESCSLINGVDNLSCSSANSSIYVSSDDEDVPMREKRIWMITEQQRRTFRRMRRLEAETRERRLANRHTHKKRTNFGWMKTVGKYPVSWGKKWKPATWIFHWPAPNTVTSYILNFEFIYSFKP